MLDNKIYNQPQTSKPVQERMNNRNSFDKGKGTRDDEGNLYETKMLCLILLRALYDDNINIISFFMSTNITLGVPGFEDIIIRYKTGDGKSHLLCLQTKHKRKGIITNDDFTDPKRKLYIQKYFNSYLNLRNKFMTQNTDEMYRGSRKYIDCAFVIYTSAVEKFTFTKSEKYKAEKRVNENNNLFKKLKDHLLQILYFILSKISLGYLDSIIYSKKNEAKNEQILGKKGLLRQISPDQYPAINNVIKTTEKGKVFQFIKDNDQLISYLMKNITETRADQLAESLSRFILKQHNPYQFKEIFKEYNFYLAFDVIDIIKEKPDGYDCKFKESFLKSSDESSIFFKERLCKKLNVTLLSASFRFELPVDICNFLVNNPTERLDVQRVCEVFLKLFQSNELHCKISESECILIKLDDDSVGPAKILRKEDINILAKSVGTLLTYDDKTNMMKFEFDELKLSQDNINILTKLRETYNKHKLCDFRFDIQYYGFPKLKLNSYCCRENDKKLVDDFISNVYVYTNQGQQNVAEDCTKKLIDKLLVRHQIHFSYYVDKLNAIYDNFHAAVYSWWQKSKRTFYLTETCDYYKKAEGHILDSCLMTTHYDYFNKIENDRTIKFTKDAVLSLALKQHLNNKKTVAIITENIYFTSVKTHQYFDEILKYKNYFFLKIDTLINSFKRIVEQLESVEIHTMVVITPVQTNNDEFVEMIKEANNVFKGKNIVIIAHSSLKRTLEKTFPESVSYNDTTNNFNSLSDGVRDTILNKKNINFQGNVVPINTVLDETFLDVLSPDLIYSILNHTEVVKIGITANEEYNIAIENYMEQSLIQPVISLNTSKVEDNDLCIVEDYNPNLLPLCSKDLVLITESEKIFQDAQKINTEANIHWFCRENDQIIWKKSHGNLHTLKKYVNKVTSPHIKQIKTLQDLEERVVIVSADSGMGKSTLLSHVAKNSRNLWIVRINLSDNINQWKNWKEKKIEINLMEVVKFILTMINRVGSKTQYNISVKDYSKILSVNNKNDIVLLNTEGHVHNEDLSEIKLFTYFYNRNKVGLLFDGFHEIYPKYKDEVTQMLCVLKTSKIAYLWVTSRPYSALEELECALGTFSFNLASLTTSQQTQYLLNMWSKYCRVKFVSSDPIRGTQSDKTVEDKRHLIAEVLNKNLKDLANVFISTINFTYDQILYDEQVFTSNPQHLYMIADIYKIFVKECCSNRSIFIPTSENFRKNLKNVSNLSVLFEKFMKIIVYDIEYCQKIPTLFRQDMINYLEMDDTINKKYKEFLQNHKLIAAHLHLEKNLLDSSEHKIQNDFIVELKSGLKKSCIVNFNEDDKPRFVKSAYAEYFAIEFVFDKLLTGTCQNIWAYYMDYLLVHHEYGIRRFINSKLQRDENKLINDIIVANKEYIPATLSNLIKVSSNISKTVLSIAIEEGNDYIALFILECFKVLLNKDNIDDFIKFISKRYIKCCIFCAAITKQMNSIVKFLIDLILNIDDNKIKDIFYCEDIKDFSPLLIAIIRKDTTDIIWKALEHKLDLFVDLYILNHDNDLASVAHFVASNGLMTTSLGNHLLKLNKEQRIRIFSVTDQNGKMPAHHAAERHDIHFFIAMKELLGEEEFLSFYPTSDKSDVKILYDYLSSKDFLSQTLREEHFVSRMLELQDE